MGARPRHARQRDQQVVDRHERGQAAPRGRGVIAAVLDRQEGNERRWAERFGEDRRRTAREVLLARFTG